MLLFPAFSVRSNVRCNGYVVVMTPTCTAAPPLALTKNVPVPTYQSVNECLPAAAALMTIVAEFAGAPPSPLTFEPPEQFVHAVRCAVPLRIVEVASAWVA